MYRCPKIKCRNENSKKWTTWIWFISNNSFKLFKKITEEKMRSFEGVEENNIRNTSLLQKFLMKDI